MDEDSKSRKIIPRPSDYSGTDAENPFQQKYLKAMSTKAEGGQCKKGQEAPRKRRARCQTCPGCLGTDCQECAPCRQDFMSQPILILVHLCLLKNGVMRTKVRSASEVSFLFLLCMCSFVGIYLQKAFLPVYIVTFSSNFNGVVCLIDLCVYIHYPKLH